MAKIVDLGVEKDHIESLTRANGLTAISELIWNALDADASIINIEINPNHLGGYESLEISDNGHGLEYSKGQEIFGKLGGSEKKITNQSPKGRAYHGKEGKGRYKALAIGDLVTYTSIYKNSTSLKEYTIVLDRNNLSHSKFSELKIVTGEDKKSGVSVLVENTNSEIVHQIYDEKNRKELSQKFASYWINYPDFNIFINGKKLEFESLIRNSEETEYLVHSEDLTHRFKIKVIEWNFDIKKKTYLCNKQGIPFREINLGIRSSIPISIFIQSIYIESLHRDNKIDVQEFDEIMADVINESKKFAREYTRKRMHFYSSEFITELKQQGIYPYKEKADNIIEESKRQVFDIVALQVNEFLPDFDNQDLKSKKFTLTLIKEALENDSHNLQKILIEVIELPKEKREELVEILEESSLSTVIDTMTEIKNRLMFLNALEELIYNRELNKNVLERKHLHKIIAKETWVFGDEYTYGVDDLTLKNVLKSYLKDHLNRDDFEEVINSEDNSNLETIPDVCLWQQFSLGSSGKENLIIELKRPSLNAGFTEKSQIEGYATAVSRDNRFPKEKTKWKFILLTKDVKNEIEPLLSQKNRKYGHIHEGENFDVYILSWGNVISEARQRLEFIKEKLNLNLMDNEKNLEFLRKKYSEYLPESL